MMRCWHTYRQNNPHITTSARGSFLLGIYNSLDNKLYQSRKDKENEKFESVSKVLGAEAKTTAENKYALICSDNKKKLESAVNKFFPSVDSARSSYTSNTNSGAYSAGYSVGKTINISRAIGNSSQKCLTY